MNLFIYYLIALLFFLSVKLIFLMSYVIYYEYRGY